MMPATPDGLPEAHRLEPRLGVEDPPEQLGCQSGGEAQRPHDVVDLVVGVGAELPVLQADRVDEFAEARLVGVGEVGERRRPEHPVRAPRLVREAVERGVDGGLGGSGAAVGVAADDLVGGRVDAVLACRGVDELAVDPVEGSSLFH